MPNSENPTVLAGDIGGTHTRLGLFTAGGRRPRLDASETFSSEAAHGLEELIERFLKNHDAQIAAACFGIAGPVDGERSRTTNLPWEVIGDKIKERFRFTRVRLMNDVAAMIRAVPLLEDKECYTLNPGSVFREGVVGLAAPGTGLGMALMAWVDGRPLEIPTEGGHVDFAPTNEREIGLWRYLRERFGHVSAERVVSGPGLFHIYEWLRETNSHVAPRWLTRALETSDRPRVISHAALNGKDPLCSDALALFVSILGAVCGNLALTGLTRGGIYLGGGIPPGILPALRRDAFMKAFTDKGRFRDLVAGIPVRVIMNDQAALLGAAHCALSSAGTS